MPSMADLPDDMYLAIYSLLNVSDRLRWRVANVKPIPESLTGSTMRTEQRVVMILKRNKNIHYSTVEDLCTSIVGPSAKLLQHRCPEYKLMIDLKSATIKEPYIDVDMREFSVYYNVAHALGQGSVDLFCRFEASSLCVGLDDMGKKRLYRHMLHNACLYRNTAMVEKLHSLMTTCNFLINVCDECNDIDVVWYIRQFGARYQRSQLGALYRSVIDRQFIDSVIELSRMGICES
jgi:hypothetical protein